MYYEARVKQGRKVVLSVNVTSMNEALDWFVKFSSERVPADYVYQIIPKYGHQ